MAAFQLKGVSTKVDSCSGLIAQAAYRAHRRLSAEHKRWVDPEDLMQQALMEAVAAEKRYRKDGGAKYSTYLHTGLFFDLSKTYTDRLKQKMRTSTGIVELDAPLASEDGRTFQVADNRQNAAAMRDVRRRALFGLEDLCRWVSPKARLVLVRVLLCGAKLRDRERSCLTELSQGVAKIGLKWEDLAVLLDDERVRKMALNQLVRRGIVGITDTDTRILECVSCEGQFSLSDVREGRYFAVSSTCRACYLRLHKDPDVCFGKLKTKGQEGYSENDVECRLHCDDKDACRSFVALDTATKPCHSKDRRRFTMANEDTDELEDVDFEEDAKPVKASKAASKTAAKKPAKAAKAKVEDDEEVAPKEVGGQWPWKRGSVMRWMFQQAYGGEKRETLEKEIKRAGHDPALMIRCLRAGKSGKATVTHTWKLNEEGGGIRPYAIVFHGKAKKTEKAEKPAAKKTVKKAAVKKAVAKKKVA